jgi:CPA2 family monovalent cation:H+ antiporter-2
LSEAVLVDVGVPMGLVIASIHERRDEYRALLKKRESEAKPIFRARRTVGKALGKPPARKEPGRQEAAAGQEA